MIEFKENIKELLPYERDKYIEFLDDDFNVLSEWYGVSFQWNDKDKEAYCGKTIEVFESIFQNVISDIDNGTFWIINHDNKDLKWFPNDNDNLKDLRSLFKQNNIQNAYAGALVFMKDDLYRYGKDLILYPYQLSYKNLDISHNELQFIIKLTSHLTIDLLCTDKMLLKKIVNRNTHNSLIIREYRGSSL